MSDHTVSQHSFRYAYSFFSALYLLFLIVPIVEHRYFGSLYQRMFYPLGIVTLILAYFLVRHFRDGIEVRLLLYYCIWAAITCILNGDPRLREYGRSLIELSLMIVLFVPGLLLYANERNKYYGIVAGIIVGFFFLLGSICIYTAVTRTYLLNPLLGEHMGYPSPTTWRYHLFGIHPNGMAGFFMISFCLTLTLIVRSKQIIFRILLGISAFICATAVALTVSRNAQTCVSVTLGIFAGILILHHQNLADKKARLFLTLLVTVAVILTSYQAFEPIRKSIWKIYESSVPHVENSVAMEPASYPSSERFSFAALSAEKSAGEAESDTFQEDTRDYFESGRKWLFWSAFKSLQIEPRRILLGSRISDVMDISHTLVKEQAVNFHNGLLQVINQFGLPALLFVLLFCWRILRFCWILVIKRDLSISLADRMLVLPIIGLMIYNMLEVESFIYTNFRSMFFFFACGMLVGAGKEAEKLDYEK